MTGSKPQELDSFDGGNTLSSKCLGKPHFSDSWTHLWVP